MSQLTPRCRRSGSRVVQVLQKLVGGKLDLFVFPLRGVVVTGNRAHPMDAPDVPVHEGVSRLGLVRRSLGER
jgi:hypothetical protein